MSVRSNPAPGVRPKRRQSAVARRLAAYDAEMEAAHLARDARPYVLDYVYTVGTEDGYVYGLEVHAYFPAPADFSHTQRSWWRELVVGGVSPLEAEQTVRDAFEVIS